MAPIAVPHRGGKQVTEDTPQQLVSIIVLLSAGLHDGSGVDDRGTAQYAFFPLMQVESLKLFDGISQGDEEQENEVFAQPRVKSAVLYAEHIVDALKQAGVPSELLLRDLLNGSEILSGSNSL